jgi:hypothetical protein
LQTRGSDFDGSFAKISANIHQMQILQKTKPTLLDKSKFAEEFAEKPSFALEDKTRDPVPLKADGVSSQTQSSH